MSGLIDGNTAVTSGDSPRADDDSDSLRSMLDAAVVEAETPETVKTVTEPEDTDTTKAERARGPDGKFVKAEGEAEPDAALVDPVVDHNAIDPNAVVDPIIDPAVNAPPANWSARDKEIFGKAPPDMQAWMLDRHKSMEVDYTKKTQAIAAFKNEYEPVSKIFEPYKEQMRQGGFTPRTLIEGWANVEQRLMRGEGVDVIKTLVQGYKIDPNQLAEAIGVSRPAPAQQPEPQFYVDPTSGQLVQQPYQQPDIGALVKQQLDAALTPIQQRLAQDDQQRAQAQRNMQIANETKVSSEIEQFKSTQDDKGNLQHPHFEEVEDQMTVLARAAIAAGQPVPSLKELYENAVWANPSTRALQIAAREKAQQDKAQAEARAKAAAAKKAGSSVTGAPGTGQTVSKTAGLSLREQLEEAAADAA